MIRVIGIAVAVALIIIVGTVAYLEITERSVEQGNEPAPGELRTSAFWIDREALRLVFDSQPYHEDVKKAEKMFRQALALFQEQHNERGESEVWNDLGILYFNLGRYSQSLEYYNKALEIKRRVKWEWAEGNTLANMAHLYCAQRKSPESLEHYDLAIKAYEKANSDRKRVAETWAELGEVYAKWGKQSDAVECFDKALKLGKAIRDTKLAARLSGNLGSFYAGQRNFAKASEYFEESVRMAKNRLYASRGNGQQRNGVFAGGQRSGGRWTGIRRLDTGHDLNHRRKCGNGQVAPESRGQAEFGCRRHDRRLPGA